MEKIIVKAGTEFSRVVVGRPEFTHIVAEGGAKVNVCVLVFPGQDAEIPLTVDLTGAGAEVVLSGLYICGGSEKVSFRTELNHHSGGCISRQEFNGIAGGQSRVAFYGRIVVDRDAQQTEAYQSNHNILLSVDAKVDTKPQLEIYADDVKCSHGATVGSLNEDEQFYMRSRGVPEEEAKVLQMISFVSPVLANIADEAEREELAAKTETAIRSIL